MNPDWFHVQSKFYDVIVEVLCSGGQTPIVEEKVTQSTSQKKKCFVENSSIVTLRKNTAEMK